MGVGVVQELLKKQVGLVEARHNWKGSRGRIGYDKQPLVNFAVNERRRGVFHFLSQTIVQVRERRGFKGRYTEMKFLGKAVLSASGWSPRGHSGSGLPAVTEGMS